VQKGRFERLALLGSGTVTVTEKARVTTGTSAGRVVTLVRLLPHAEADHNLRGMFIEKAQGLMRLSDTNIVEALELGRTNTHYLAREHIEGHSMRKLLKTLRADGEQVPVGFACDVVVQLGATLISLRRRMHHIAPRFQQASFGSTLRTLVFDLAGRLRWVDPFALDDTHQPRQHEDPPRDEARALGALLYELCVGRPPPPMTEVVEFALVAPSTFSEQIPPAIDALVARALGFGPEPPFHGVGEFTDALDSAAQGLGSPDPSWLRAVVGAPVAEPSVTRTPSEPRSIAQPAPPLPERRTVNERPPQQQKRADPTPPAVVIPPVTPLPARRPALAPLSQLSSFGFPNQDPPRSPTPPAPIPSTSGSFAIGDGIMLRSQNASMRVRAIAAGAILVVAAIVLIVTRTRAPSHVAIAAAPPPAEEAAPSKPVTEQLPVQAKAPLELGRLPAPETIVQQQSTPVRHAVRRGGRGRVVASVAPAPAPIAAPAAKLAAGPPAVTPPPPAAPAPAPAPAPKPLPPPAVTPPPAARPTPPPAPTSPLHIPYSAYVSSRRISGEEPRIPPALRSQIEAGSAVARICVAVDGRVENVTVLRATTGMEDPLRQAVRTWRYRPFELKGRAVPACFEMPFAFKRAD
jgi:TonB family protein